MTALLCPVVKGLMDALVHSLQSVRIMAPRPGLKQDWGSLFHNSAIMTGCN